MSELKHFDSVVNLFRSSRFISRKIAFSLIIFLLANLSAAATIHVPADYPTIEAAIAATDPFPTANTILVSDGNYTPLASSGYFIDGSAGRLITIKSVNGPLNCFIDCKNAGRAFYFSNGTTSNVVIDGFTIKNGNYYYGGAIECETNCSPVIKNCILKNNSAVYGGAIDCYDSSSPIIQNCIIIQNSSDFEGGAIECETHASPDVNNCLLAENTSGMEGGAIDCYDTSSPKIRNCTIANNIGDANLGGIYADSTSSSTITNSILWKNACDIYGPNTISYSCIQNNVSGTGTILHSNPIFKTGPLGNYYLSQTDANQLQNSPCINVGSTTAAAVFGSGSTLTTRTDSVADSGTVDMGFHFNPATNTYYTLTASVEPNQYATISVDPNFSSYMNFADVNVSVTITNPNYHVQKWTIDSVDVNDTNTTRIIAMDSNHIVVAKLVSSQMCDLSAFVVDSNLGSMDFNNTTQRYVQHSRIDVNAYPIGGYVVKKWYKGNTIGFNINDANIAYDPCVSNPLGLSLILDSNTTLAVQFGPNSITHRYSPLVVSGAGTGTITPGRRTDYPEGFKVQLTAAPYPGYILKQWTGTDNDACTTLTNTVTMNTDRNVTVEFGPVPQYWLNVTVNDPNFGSVSPGSGWYNAGSTVTLTATPAEGYRVKSWAGDANTWRQLTYSVTMDVNNKTVAVIFEADINRVIHVFGDDPNGIQPALNIASNGDTIEIHPGTYVSTGFTINKTVTIVGDPEHPENVVIDGSNHDAADAHIGFELSSPGVVTLNGLTIANLHYTGRRPYVPPNPIPGTAGGNSQTVYRGALSISGNHIIKNCVINNCSLTAITANDGIAGHRAWDINDVNTPTGGNGGNGGGAFGAGIFIYYGNPLLENVNVENSTVHAGRGGDGASGWSDPTHRWYPVGDPTRVADHNYFDPGSGGTGGNGGSAAGAGIFVQSGNPKFTNVTESNCIAISSNGGNGGPAQTDGDGNDGGLPGVAWGAGIYCSPSSNPVFTNCTINDCKGYNGVGGNGSDAGPVQYRGGSGGYGGLTTDTGANQGDIKIYTAKGGAIYCDSNSNSGSKSVFVNCNFNNNILYGSISGIGGYDSPGHFQEPPRRNYRLPSYGAGIFCSSASLSDFNNCSFSGNRTAYNQDYADPNYLNTIDANLAVAGLTPYEGDYTGMGGGLCLWYVSDSNVRGCTFTGNSAPLGGGLYAERSVVNVGDSNLSDNISIDGGGLSTLESTLMLSNSVFSGNIAGTVSGIYPDTSSATFGTGGGVYALDTYADINDCVITNNFAKLTGGGICFDGDNNSVQIPIVKNCLITANTAGQEGGGIAVVYFAEPKIIDCTIADNIVSASNGNGGGLFASYAAYVIVKDSIFWNNTGNDGSQIALSNSGDFTDMPSDAVVSYSNIDLRYKAAGDITSLDTVSSVDNAPTLIASQTIYNQINSSGSANVIVSLVEPSEAQTTDWSSTSSVSKLRTQIATLQSQVFSTLNAGEFTLNHKYTNLAAFSGQINLTGLNKLINNPSVSHIEPVRIAQLELRQGIPLMNAMNTRGTYNGQGISIAIVDTGIDYTHPRLGGGAFPNSKVIGGWDFGDNDSDPKPSTTTTEGGHGTCCAGIVAGLLGTVGDYIGGVAYNAKLYALKASPDTSDGLPFDATLAAWDWCITHQNDNPANPILVISNSWGIYNYPINNHQDADALSPAHTAAAQTAVDAGITILASSGNDGFAGQGISWPSAMSNVISVGAVYDAAFISPACGVQTQPDQVTCYSNTADILNVLAPSENAYTTDIVGAGGFDPGDYYPYFNGTSAACPYAAGGVAAIQSAAKQLIGKYLTPGQVRGLLALTGSPVTDTKVAITKPRVDVGAAIAYMTGSAPIHTDSGCTLIGLAQDANGTWVISDNHNIYQDPNFVMGYYLANIAALQDFTSPCVDIGSDTAANLGLDKYTTRIDGVYDTGIVDLGYHYFKGLPSYSLTIIADTNDANGTIAAPWIPGHSYNVYIGNNVNLTAVPDVNTRVAYWILDGQTNQTHSNNFNVVMNGPHTVTVKFEHFIYAPQSIIVPDDFVDIQQAIDAAQNGDTVYVFRRGDGQPYYISSPTGLDFKGKQIIIRSEDPQDPNLVAATVIDCNFAGRAFIFQNSEGPNSVIDGLTIINSLSAGAIATQPVGIGVNGNDAAGNGFGGSIFVGKNTSPVIRNCVFKNCRVTGGIASDGTTGYSIQGTNDSTSRGGNGGNGGNGSGNGYGGAIYCDQNSSPTIFNCTIGNSTANGGIGGDGGNGGTGDTSKIGGDGGNGGNGSGNGYGGAVYAVKNSKPCLINCSFVSNSVTTGIAGKGGLQGAGNIPTQPPYAHDGFDGQSSGTGNAGAIYYEKGSCVDINNCTFLDNNSVADGGAILCEPNCPGISIVKTNMSGNRTFLGGGGAISFGVTNNIFMTDCYFGGNIADANGGALAIGSLTDSNLCGLCFNNCAFTDNLSDGVGGAISARNIEANLIDCFINRNTAVSGAGLHAVGNKSSINIYGGTVMNNTAIGIISEGGGAYISDLPAQIINCQITGNTSNYNGAGVMLKGPGTTSSIVRNCLFVGNNTVNNGGAINVSLNSSPQITNCTFSQNKCSSGGAGGAILCAYNSSPTIRDCIFDRTERFAIYEASSDCNPVISYCLFNQNDYDFYNYYQNKIYTTADDVNRAAFNAATGGHNINGNPIFLNGPLGSYYLSQTIADPCQTNSPAIDSGSRLAKDVNVLPDDNMADYTTRTDSNNLIGRQGDTNTVDIGFHFVDIDANKPKQFMLTTTVNGGHGSISPPTGNYYAGVTVPLTALPDPGWRVNKWTGTDDDSSNNNTNYVVMICDKNIIVSFEQPRDLYVPAQYTSPQDAINAAKSGDKIILAAGTYYLEESDYDWTRLRIIGRSFTITGTNPDDPNVVAQTVLLGNSFDFTNVDSNMILDGITIQGAHYYGGIINCSLPGAHGPTGDGANGGSVWGGALVLNNSSPTVRNCHFVDCAVFGSNGCDGTGDYGDGGWAGFAWGGAAFIDSTSNPVFKNCQFINCYAQGSYGMNGSGRYGHGGNWGDPNRTLITTWDFGPYNDPAYYSGYGGAVYAMGGSRPQFINCLFQGNRSYGGVSGISGSASGQIAGFPYLNYAIDTFGGAVYLASGSVATFTSCDFNDNEAHTRGQLPGTDPNVPNTNILGVRTATIYDPVMSYGGAICAEGTAIPIIKYCTFINNLACAGGGMYWEDSIAHISMSKFRSNMSMMGGAVVLADSNSIFSDCKFTGNIAVSPIGQGGAIYSAVSNSKFYDCDINSNSALTSGGGVYLTGELSPLMHNCLVINNTAGRDGAGVSTNWDAQLSLENCTFASNTATSFGGGLSCAYQANTKIINSIFWNDIAHTGNEISIGSNFDAADKLSAAVSVSYSDISGGAANVFVDSASGCILNWDYTSNLTGTSLTNPQFVTGSFGDYYLSQSIPSAPNDVNSPCVDKGFGTAIDNDMFKHTTRIDNVLDSGIVDMGYHYTLTSEILGDFNFDGIVDATDYQLFDQYWLESDCSFPYFCQGRDLNGDGQVDFEDFALFAANWCAKETIPPHPNPATWAVRPHSTSQTAISMQATTEIDNSGSLTQYMFQCVFGPTDNNSGWISSPSWIDTGLTTGKQYGYMVKARDTSANYNETGWSTIAYAVAGEDITPPTPNPMEWATPPFATSSSSIRMAADVAFDDTTGSNVQYYFHCSTPGGHDSIWQNNTIYEDTGLEANTPYTYMVKARDTSSNHNETFYSDPCTAITLAAGQESNEVNVPTVDTTPPQPSPSQWSVVPQAIQDQTSPFYWHHTMTAVTAIDANSPPVQYYFDSTDSQLKSSWISEPNYTTIGLNGPTYNTAYRVKTRDSANPPNESGWSQWYSLQDGYLP